MGLGICELVLRMIGFSYPVFGVYDELLGTAAPAGVSGWQTEEGHTFVRFNEHGYRDRERILDKPAGVTRVAVLGDSFVQALQVDLDSTFVSILERELLRCQAHREGILEVMNFGVGGYGPAQQLLALQHRVWAFSPDVILLTLFTGNDIINDSKELELDRIRPFFVLDEGELSLDTSFRDDPRFRRGRSWPWRAANALSHHSRTLQLLYKVRHRAEMERHRRRRATERGDLRLAGETQGLTLSPLLYRPPEHGAWSEAWTVTEKVLLRFREEVEAKNARLVVVTLSNGIQVHPDPGVRDEYMRSIGVEDLFYPERRLRDFSERNGIEFLSLAPLLLEVAEKTRTCLHGFPNAHPCYGHWNERGHRAAGSILARYFCETGI